MLIFKNDFKCPPVKDIKDANYVHILIQCSMYLLCARDYCRESVAYIYRDGLNTMTGDSNVLAYVFCSFVMRCCPCTCSWYVIRACALTKWRPTANTLRPHDRKALELFRSYALKQSAKAPLPENFLATGGSFECNTFLIATLDWLKKEREIERKEERKKERKKMNDSDFWPFQVCPFKMVTVRCHYYCRLGQAL